jgi:hypothetical protein
MSSDFWIPLVIRLLAPGGLGVFSARWPLRILFNRYVNLLSPVGPTAAAFTVALGTIALLFFRSPSCVGIICGLISVAILAYSLGIWLAMYQNLASALGSSARVHPSVNTNQNLSLLRRIARQKKQLWWKLYSGAVVAAAAEQIRYTIAWSGK